MPVLYYIRHGETDMNVAQRLQGRCDPVLNECGRQQAIGCGKSLRDLFQREGRQPQDYSYVSSPLKRARETMELLRGELGLDLHAYAVDERLREVSYGEWEGLTLPEIETRFAGALARREHDKWDFAPPGGESYRSLFERTSTWYAEITRDTVIAGHGGGVRALIALFGIMAKADAAHFEVAQGGIYVFRGGKVHFYGG
jgi:broad specificity phosphatase PhoE